MLFKHKVRSQRNPWEFCVWNSFSFTFTAVQSLCLDVLCFVGFQLHGVRSRCENHLVRPWSSHAAQGLTESFCLSHEETEAQRKERVKVVRKPKQLHLTPWKLRVKNQWNLESVLLLVHFWTFEIKKKILNVLFSAFLQCFILSAKGFYQESSA